MISDCGWCSTSRRATSTMRRGDRAAKRARRPLAAHRRRQVLRRRRARQPHSAHVTALPRQSEQLGCRRHRSRGAAGTRIACRVAAGLSLTIHAIGDRANRDVLNVLAEVRRQETKLRIVDCGLRIATPVSQIHNPKSEIRNRIEHVQCIHPDDLPRLAELDVIASVQPIHATLSDMHMVDRFWGEERARGAYAFPPACRTAARSSFSASTGRSSRTRRSSASTPRSRAAGRTAHPARMAGRGRSASRCGKRSTHTRSGRPTPRAKRATEAASCRAKWRIWWFCPGIFSR